MDFLNKAKEQMSGNNANAGANTGFGQGQQQQQQQGGAVNNQNEDYGDKGSCSPFFHPSINANVERKEVC
jgi:hypothetical protein